MKTRLLLSIFAVLMSFSLSSYAQRKSEVKIKTSAECNQCKEQIEKLVNGLKGVKKATLDLASRELTVVYLTKKIEPADIRKIIAGAGWDADDVKANTKKPSTPDNKCVNPHLDGK